MFLGAQYDVGTWWGREAIEARRGDSNWLGSRMLKGAGHWLQQERAPKPMPWSWSSCARCEGDAAPIENAATLREEPP